MNEPALFRGEDWLSARCPSGTDIQAMATHFRHAGDWEEVVPGMTDLTVKYDPAALSDKEAEAQFRACWETPVGLTANDVSIALLNACFGKAPDREMASDALGIDADSLPEWLCSRSYRVTMMGFQPGFAYLEDLDGTKLPTLPRLGTPRQHIAAGSIGFLGKRACIYALDGPGGWPIVGRVQEPLFRRDDPQPFLLQPGQIVRFSAA